MYFGVMLCVLVLLVVLYCCYDGYVLELVDGEWVMLKLVIGVDGVNL